MYCFTALQQLKVISAATRSGCVSDDEVVTHQIYPDTVLYPYGVDFGDSLAVTGNNLFDGPLTIPGGFPFLGDRHSTIYVSRLHIIA